MENSTYVLLASNNWLSGSSSVTPVRSVPSSNSSHVVIAPRQSYATIASPADQNFDTRQNAGSQVPKNVSVQRVPSNGNEIRLVVENQKDNHEPAAVGFTNGESLRTGYTSIVGGNGVRIQIPTSGLTVSLPAVRKIAPASASPNVSNPNATRSHLVRGTSSANAKSGNTVNRMVWNSASSVSGSRSQQTSAVSPSKLIIQINPQQLSLITDMSQSAVQPNAERQPGAVSRLSGTQMTGPRPSGSRVPPTHQPIQPKIVPGITAATSVTCSVVVASNQLRGAVQSNQSTRVGSSGGLSATTQRRILPATVQVQQQPILAATGLFQSLPGQSSGALSCQLTGGSLPQAGGSIVPAFAFVSQAGYNFVQTQALVSGNHLPGPVMDLSDGRDSDEYSSSQRISGSSWGDVSHAGGLSAARPKKPCNCTKSQCLKLYCECFAGGEFCNDCNCTNCFNNLLHEDERARAIKTCRDRNPYAFHPKIGKGGDIRKHCKGCNCKRSGCLKNYCECYEAKIMCSNLCRCIGCKNIEESPDRQTLLHLANAAEVRVLQQVAAETKLSSHNIRPPVRPVPPPAGVERPAYMFINLDVIEAIASCLSEEGEKGEHEHRSDVVQERRLIEEFGRCLRQVIESASRTRGSHS